MTRDVVGAELTLEATTAAHDRRYLLEPEFGLTKAGVA
jgi:hypothetical protein